MNTCLLLGGINVVADRCKIISVLGNAILIITIFLIFLCCDFWIAGLEPILHLFLLYMYLFFEGLDKSEHLRLAHTDTHTS